MEMTCVNPCSGGSIEHDEDHHPEFDDSLRSLFLSHFSNKFGLQHV
jgi:hypothetical protein